MANGAEMRREVTVFSKEVVITEKMDKILRIFDKWGITYSFCDSDVLDIIEEIITSLEQERIN
jgi:hypothetical protein